MSAKICLRTDQDEVQCTVQCKVTMIETSIKAGLPVLSASFTEFRINSDIPDQSLCPKESFIVAQPSCSGRFFSSIV